MGLRGWIFKSNHHNLYHPHPHHYHQDELTEQWLSLCAGVLFSVEPLSPPHLLLRDPEHVYHDGDVDDVDDDHDDPGNDDDML